MPSSAQTFLQIPSLPDLDLCLVEGGTFLMGDETGDLYDACRPVHPVRLSDFYIGKFPVTQRLWQAVMGDNPSHFKGEKRPVENVSWEDAQKFLTKLNAREEVKNFLHSLAPAPPAEPPQAFLSKLFRPAAPPPAAAKMQFRLPTEAEWEFAARGGNLSQGYAFSGSDKLRQVGWHDKNSGNETHDVGLLFPNELGIHDMSGNVWEWCNDWFGGTEYYEECLKKGLVENPPGAVRGVYRVYRGGGYLSEPLGCRPAYRGNSSPDLRRSYLGFRLVLPFQAVG